jgi:hypothetical protein
VLPQRNAGAMGRAALTSHREIAFSGFVFRSFGDGFAAHTQEFPAGAMRRPRKIATCTASSVTLTSSCVRPSMHNHCVKNWGSPRAGAARPKKRDPVARGLMSNSVRQSDVRRLHKGRIVPQHG